ncbi:hypothetical protein Ddye_020393 [Dipteronia dyeriana]|uniref:Uncharacterized protein n=1 Tax=Dipteronia dyeriana TaxID=168575 RepID=A0AAD9WWJ1_9ROSI|nr:hypothetical protein Ddye_020393 [Dipteronia dyeriana]
MEIQVPEVLAESARLKETGKFLFRTFPVDPITSVLIVDRYTRVSFQCDGFCAHLAFPNLFDLISTVCSKATVINVAANGNIIRKFQDPNGKVMSFVTSAFEFEDNLYLGSLNSNFMENCH